MESQKNTNRETSTNNSHNKTEIHDDNISETEVHSNQERTHQVDDTKDHTDSKNLGLNAKNIEKLVYSQTIKIQDKKADESDQNRKKADLTEAYVYQKTTDNEFKFRAIKDVAKQLKKSRIILLKCDDYTLGNEAFLSLIDTMHHNAQDTCLRMFNPYEGSHLSEHDNNDDKNDSSILSIDVFIKNCRQLSPKTWVFTQLDANNNIHKNSEFLAPFGNQDLRDSYFRLKSDQLKSRNQYWVIAVPSQTQIQHCNVTYWTIDQLNCLLDHYCKNININIEQLNQQIEQKMWEPNHIAEIHRLMMENRFESRFKKYCTDLKSISNSDNDFSKLIDNNPNRYLYKCLLFIICHFPELSPTFFEKILSVLLEGASVFVPQETQQQKSTENINNKAEQSPVNIEITDGERVIKVNTGDETTLINNSDSKTQDPEINNHSKTQDAWHYWQENKGAIFKACHIISKTQPGKDESIMGFSESAFVKAAENALKQDNPLYFDDYFFKIFYSDLLLHRSNDVADAVLKLLQLKMLQEPKSFDAEWMINWVISILIETEGKISQKADDFKKYLEKIKTMHNSQMILYRWTQLLMMLLNQPKLSHIVGDFMNRLIKTYDSEDLALQFIRRLRNFAGFDAMSFIKRLLGQTSVNDINSIDKKINFLSSYLQEQLLLNPQLMDELIEWQPDPKRHQNLSAIHICALKLPFLMSCKSISKEMMQSLKLPEQLFPFIIDCNGMEFSQHYESLIQLMTNRCQPLMKQHFDALIYESARILFLDMVIVNDKGEKTHLAVHIINELFAVDSQFEAIMCLQLIMWQQALKHNHRTDSENNPARQCIKKIVQSIYDSIDKKHIKLIRVYLKTIRSRVRNTKNQIYGKGEKRYLAGVSQSIKYLINHFYQLNKSARKEQ